MFESLFRSVLTMSAGASLVILAVLALRIVLRKAPKRFSYILWALVIIRLLCPVFPESGISLMPGDVDMAAVLEAVTDQKEEAVQSLEPSASVDVPELAPQYPVTQKPSTGAVTPQQPSAGESYQPPMQPLPEQTVIEKPLTQMSKLDGWQIGSVVWLAGIWVMALYGVWSLFRLKSRLAASMALGGGVYLADHIDTPFVMGLFRPKIYLPSYLKLEKAEYIILHEKYHISRFDHVVKLLYFAALCLHWFNPLVWLAFVLMGYDMEMSCDEAVMEKMNRDVRRDYANSLLQLSTGRRKIAPTPLAFGEGDPKGRIKNVLNYRKPRFWIVLVAVVVCIAAAVCLLTNPAETDKEYLNYPGLQWGMSPEEVKSALELDENNILNEDGSDGDSDAPLSVPSRYVIEAEKITCFGEEVALAKFHFTDYSAAGNALGLERIELFYPDEESGNPVDMDRLVKKLGRYYGDSAEEFLQYVEVVGTGTAKIQTDPIPDGMSYWFSEKNLDSYLTQEKKDLIYQVYADAHADSDYPILDREQYGLRWQATSLVTVQCTENYFSGGSETGRDYGRTDNYVHMNANGMRYIDAFLELYKDGLPPTDEEPTESTESTEPTESTQLVDPDPLLNYPGLQWGMTPEEVKNALRLRDKQIKSESENEARTDYVLSVTDLECFGEKVNLATFYFTDDTKMGGAYGLYDIQLFYPDEQSTGSADLEKILIAMTECYGQPAQEMVRIDFDMNTSTAPVPEGEYHWNSALTLDTWMTPEQKELLYQYQNHNLIDKSDGDRESFDRWLKQRCVSWVRVYSDFLGETDNAVRADGLTDYCVYLSTAKTWADGQIKELTARNGFGPYLQYPMLTWGMDPEVVRLNFEYMGWTVDSDELQTRDSMKRTIELSGKDFFGHKVKKLVVEFTGEQETNLKLSFVRVVLDSSVSAADIEKELTMRYGAEPEKYWDCELVDGKYTQQMNKPITVMSAWPSFASLKTRYSNGVLDALRSLYESENGVKVSDEDWAKFAENSYLVSMMFGVNGKANPNRETEESDCIVIDYDASELIAYDAKAAKIRQSYDAALLNYPGLDWGMTIEEVKAALGFGDDAITEVIEREINVTTYCVENLDYFGMPTEGVVFSFSSLAMLDDGERGLYEVIVHLPDDTDMEKAKQTVTAYYGDPIDSYSYMTEDGYTITQNSEKGNDLWLSEATSGNTFSEAEQEFYCRQMIAFYGSRHDFKKENIIECLRTTPLTQMNLSDDLYGKVYNYDSPDREIVKAVRYNSNVYGKVQFFDHYREQVEHIGMLNYPLLDWGMTIEEVKAALGFGDDAIVNVEDRGNVMGYYVEGLNYFDLPTEQILLNFTSYHGNPWGLYEVVVLLPDDTDMERAKQTVTAYYGEPIDSYSYPDLLSGKTITEKSEEGNDLWLSEATSGNTFSEAELEFCCQYWKEQYAGGFEITKENVMEHLRTTPLTRLNLTDDLHGKVFHIDHPDLEKIKAVRYNSSVYDMEQFFAYHADKIG